MNPIFTSTTPRDAIQSVIAEIQRRIDVLQARYSKARLTSELLSAAARIDELRILRDYLAKAEYQPVLGERMTILKGAEIYIESDMVCGSSPCICNDAPHCPCVKTAWFLRTLHDPTVGIEGVYKSEPFDSEALLVAWVNGLSETDFNKLLDH